ncbi:MAG TPA: PDZ domain-containing protein [Atopostipes sp.]|nr:PDZ domain-containing protein [Atopostipes sp.]
MTNILWAILLYFLQPVFIIGLLYTIFNRNKRVKYSRKNFRVNFNRTNFELKDFFIKGLLPGILVSILSLVLGVPLTIEWYLIYQIVAILFLLIGGSRFIHPIFTFSMTSILMYAANLFQFDLNFQWLQPVINENLFIMNFELNSLPSLLMNVLLFTSFILLITTFVMSRDNENKIFPILGSSKRGKTIALYPNKSLWVLPMLIVVPGEVIEPFADWWPLLNIGGERFALLILPVLIGLHYTVSTQLLNEATSIIQKEFRWLSLVGLLGVVLTYFYPILSVVVTGLLLIIGLFILYRHRKRENLWTFRYGPADEGLRVIAVRPDSPAERLNLSIGDIIMDMNDKTMNSREEFNEMLAYNRSYIKMRIKRKDGEIVIAETPLYDDDYNNLGLLILEN